MEIEQLIAQSVTTIRSSFNSKGLPDYTWVAIDGHRVGTSRKQAGELLGGIDEAEVQLKKDMVGVDEMKLLVEGVFSPPERLRPKDTKTARVVDTWIPTKDGKLLHRGRKYDESYGGVYAWFDQLDKCGITIVQTFDWVGTAMVLVALYKNSQKPEHTTLKRYIKPKITPKPANPNIEVLMYTVPGLGEKGATALIERYGTAWMVYQQEPGELALTEGMGIVMARKVLTRIGRVV